MKLTLIIAAVLVLATIAPGLAGKSKYNKKGKSSKSDPPAKTGKTSKPSKPTKPDIPTKPSKGKGGKEMCRVHNGKKMRTFANTLEYIRFPCKYHAIRQTQCGDWKVTVTPGNMLENIRHKLYVIRSVWVSAERKDGRKWEGRTDLKIAQKYLDGMTDAPFNTKDGSLDIKQVFEFGPQSADGEVSLIAKNGDFMISFGLFEPYGKWHKGSTLEFVCYSDNFVPNDFPGQVCGNGTNQEVRKEKMTMEYRDNRQAAMFHSIFTNDGLIQTDSDCLSAQRVMTNRCVQKGEDLSEKAATLCWPLVGKPKHQRCISENMDSPISAFRHCVEFVCSGYTDKNACISLGNELDMCPNLPQVSNMVKKTCKKHLYCN